MFDVVGLRWVQAAFDGFGSIQQHWNTQFLQIFAVPLHDSDFVSWSEHKSNEDLVADLV